MDATSAAIVVFVFVISIFTSFGDNKGFHQPKIGAKTGKPPAYNVVNSSVPIRYVNNQKRPIANYIAGFRKPAQAVQIAEAIDKHSKSFDVNPKVVAALMRRESGFNPRALSKSGAMGLGQLLPSTAKSLGVTNGYDIDQNARGTVRYVKYLLGRFKNYNDPVKYALAGYLEGPNAVARKKGYKPVTGKYVNDILAIYQKI